MLLQVAARRKNRLRNLLVARKRPTARRQMQRNATRIELNCSKKDGKAECKKGEQCAKRKAYDAELKQILTEEQYQKYLNR